jgi:riboflavin transporter FmnP
MTEKEVLIRGIIIGALITIIVLYVFCWIVEYGVNLPLYQKAGIICFFGGAGVMYCLTKIEWNIRG